MGNHVINPSQTVGQSNTDLTEDQESFMSGQSRAWRSNLGLAHQTWGKLPKPVLNQLKTLIETYGLSVASGHLQFLDGRWYVTHGGLLHLAESRRCSGIRVQQVREFCDMAAGRWVFKATVYKSPRSRGFVGYGDADPSNVSPLVRGAEMRVAETRAVNRALRKAYGIGLCSVEEIRSFPFRSGNHFQPAILAVGLFSLSPIELGLPCGQSHAAALVSAFGSAPSRPSVPGERRGGFSLFSSPLAGPNLTPSPGAKSRKHLTVLSA